MCRALAEKTGDYRERKVKIGLIQLAGSSLEVAERFVQQAAQDRPDVVILPELGCGQEPQEITDSIIIQTMQRHARQGGMYVLVNVVESDAGRAFNTTAIIGRNGEIGGTYRKVHLPLVEERDNRREAGTSLPVFDLEFGSVGIEVCFDNYFPESVRCLALDGAEIVFFPHQEHYCWNEVEHVEILSRARAIENVVFMVPCGPTAAEDGPFGRTAIIDPTGEYVLRLPPREEGYGSATIDLGLIDRVLIDGGPVSMRTQMLGIQGERPLHGRRRPETYSPIGRLSGEAPEPA